MAATLIELVGDTELLRDLAGPRSYERGVGYAADGDAHSLTGYKGKLVATYNRPLKKERATSARAGAPVCGWLAGSGCVVVRKG